MKNVVFGDANVVAADSMQTYRQLYIVERGTAKNNILMIWSQGA
jgi:tRNA A37 N6-isopentenylltransferase MiaA